ncbi:MAG: hypothetical protein VKJ27_01750 [Synechocystis sp.]|nr:hypothetical protein [Synechocystis sp.]
MPDFQTFIAIVTTLLVFLTGVALKYDTIYFRNYQLSIPQWVGLSFAGLTFTFVVLDQLLRGFVRIEKEQRTSGDRSRAMAREAKQDREREEDRSRAENERIEARNRRAEAREREARRDEREARQTGIENRYRLALARYQLDPNPVHRQQLINILALLEEYGEVF